jgi:hypothetical protein
MVVRSSEFKDILAMRGFSSLKKNMFVSVVKMADNQGLFFVVVSIKTFHSTENKR